MMPANRYDNALPVPTVAKNGVATKCDEVRRVLDEAAGSAVRGCLPVWLSEARRGTCFPGYVASDLPSWPALFTARVYQPVPENMYQQACRLTGPPERREELEKLWQLVEQRREMDIEYWFHRLAACWLHLHRAAAAVLLVLVVAHVIGSVKYGGW